MKQYLFLLAGLLATQQAADACTSLLAGKNATIDGSTMITYSQQPIIRREQPSKSTSGIPGNIWEPLIRFVILILLSAI